MLKLSNHNLSILYLQIVAICKKVYIQQSVVKQMTEKLKGFAVQPKLDCPHLTEVKVDELKQFLLNKNTEHFSQFKCCECQDKSQNWICLQCQTIACSRYVNGHMAEHHDKTKHNITLSFSDSSFWCYQCNSYIDSPWLIKARRQFSKSKFASAITIQESKQQMPKSQKQQQQQLEKALSKMEINEEQQQSKQHIFKYQEIIQNLKNKKYKRIVFLTGAGLSVAAGIPDFRSPGTGLYSQLQKLNLPRPEAVFQLSYFLQNPIPFVKLSKQWLGGNYQPTDGHKFIKKMQSENILHYCMTQNIDDLETKAGVSANKLIQAHGHSREAHCVKCKKFYSIDDWVKSIQKQEVLKCNNQQCASFVKPDIVFFGEQLPVSFHSAPNYVQQADLVFIIGTSLAVFPFAFLAHKVPEGVPIVLINNEDSFPQRKDKVWMSGDIQENIRKICKDLDWQL